MLEETRESDVALLRMNDPPRRNAFSIPMRLALLEKFRALEADPSVRAVVLAGGDQYFSVGGDLNAQGPQPLHEALDRMRIIHDLVRLMAQSSKPRVCAVEGWAVGGGMVSATGIYRPPRSRHKPARARPAARSRSRHIPASA